MIENGIRPLADKYNRVICITFNVSERFLLTGEGEMFESSPYEREFLLLFSKLLPETQEYLLIVAKELLNKQQKLIGNDRNSRYEPLKSI